MKHLTVISLLLLSSTLYAQTKNPDKPVNSDPNITVTPGVHTTITNQPPSMPNSNTNPTTGIVISPKASKANKPSGTGMPDTMLNKSRTGSATHKRAAKRKKLV